jgi:hypothetical protein
VGQSLGDRTRGQARDEDVERSGAIGLSGADCDSELNFFSMFARMVAVVGSRCFYSTRERAVVEVRGLRCVGCADARRPLVVHGLQAALLA